MDTHHLHALSLPPSTTTITMTPSHTRASGMTHPAGATAARPTCPNPSVSFLIVLVRKHSPTRQAAQPKPPLLSPQVKSPLLLLRLILWPSKWSLHEFSFPPALSTQQQRELFKLPVTNPSQASHCLQAPSGHLSLCSTAPPVPQPLTALISSSLKGRCLRPSQGLCPCCSPSSPSYPFSLHPISGTPKPETCCKFWWYGGPFLKGDLLCDDREINLTYPLLRSDTAVIVHLLTCSQD